MFVLKGQNSINGTFMPAAQGANARLWVGETGILVVLVLLLITPLVWRAWRPQSGQPEPKAAQH